MDTKIDKILVEFVLDVLEVGGENTNPKVYKEQEKRTNKAKAAIDQLLLKEGLESRLIELDLFEQLLNRSQFGSEAYKLLNNFKITRLNDLTRRLAELDN